MKIFKRHPHSEDESLDAYWQFVFEPTEEDLAKCKMLDAATEPLLVRGEPCSSLFGVGQRFGDGYYLFEDADE